MTNTTFTPRSYEFTPYVACKNWIGGEWTDSASGKTHAVINPRHGKEMGQMAWSDESDTNRAIAAAEKAFPAWKATPMKERAQVLYRVKQIMESKLDELAWLLSHENGKTIAQAKGEVLKGIECVEYGCSLPNIAQGEQLDVSRGINCSVTHEPLGVCAGIVPFNFPSMVPLWMLPQVLVAGNTFVLKPSEQVPYSSMRLAEIFKEAGLPDGVLNIVNGGKETVEALCDSTVVKALGFVGSTKVAKIVYARGAQTGKKVLGLGGAKNHLIVVPDADVKITSETVVASAYGCAGQRCMAASVMVGVGDIQPIVDKIVEITKGVKLGEEMGSIITPESVERINKYITDAEARGATVLVDGRGQSVDGQPGNWVGPTVLDNVSPDMPAGCEEIFGPVLSIIRTDTLDKAIAIENNNAYGNAAAIFTTSGAVARYAMERVSAGMCGVNIGVPVPREPFAFGGWNDSKLGSGDLTGYDGFRFWTRPRKVTSRWATAKDATWMS
ncbi:MAG: malonate-semialdehyde dehydrogenase (acetylating)/methylmalonate-semialdehyde dehydrogenase [Polyangiales bacterium]|jgi:malonate-semialdehyde dehydrogenase (acetylating)/methylmalonate-semialdehyde dehydrogenase